MCTWLRILDHVHGDVFECLYWSFLHIWICGMFFGSNVLLYILNLVSQDAAQTPAKQHIQHIPHQAQYHPLQQGQHEHIDQSPHATHFMHNPQCVPPSQLQEISHNQQQSSISQHISCLQSLGHVTGRLHVMVGYLYFLAPFPYVWH